MFSFSLLKSPREAPPSAPKPALVAAKPAEIVSLDWIRNITTSSNAADDGKPFVTLANVHKSYGQREALRGINFSVKRGNVLKPIRNLAKGRAGMVFQHFNLFEHMTALENVMEAPIRVYGQPRMKVLDLTESAARDRRLERAHRQAAA